MSLVFFCICFLILIIVILVHAFGLNGQGAEAVELFRKIPLDTIDLWTYTCVLNACSHSGLINEAEEIFSKIPVKDKTERIYTTMVNSIC